MYEMMTGTLNFKLLQDDSPYVLGALLTRLAARAGAEELDPNPRPRPTPSPSPLAPAPAP